MSLLAKIHAVRSTPLLIVKERKNKGLNSDYANLADIMEKLLPVLEKNGLSVAAEPGKLAILGENAWVQTMHIVVSDGAEFYTRECDVCFPAAIMSRTTGGAAVNEAQRQGMAQTYGRRYAIVAFFNILTGDDDDAARLGVERETASAGVSDYAPWAAFLDAGWQDALAPDGRTIGALSDKERLALWEKDPASKPLMAWIGDRITDRLQDAGYTWLKFTAWADAGLPETLEACTPGLLKIAATKSKQIPGV